MNILFLLALLVSGAGTDSDAPTEEMHSSTEIVHETAVIVLDVRYQDGTIQSFELNEQTAKTFRPKNLNMVTTCTYRTPDRSCWCTRPSCEAALECFQDTCINGDGNPENSDPGDCC